MSADIILVTLDQQIACAEREVRMREKLYPKWVTEHRMVESRANHEIAAMKAILTTLKTLKESKT